RRRRQNIRTTEKRNMLSVGSDVPLFCFHAPRLSVSALSAKKHRRIVSDGTQRSLIPNSRFHGIRRMKQR
ncbi:MAG: hypothetical protein ACYC26_11165, partial [Phycisphaerales bacterium]